MFNTSYELLSFISRDGSILGANLTIPDISDDDFSKRFTCTLVSSQSVHGQTNIVASLVKAECKFRSNWFIKLASI